MVKELFTEKCFPFVAVSIEKHVKVKKENHIDVIALDDSLVEKYDNAGRFSIRKLPLGSNALYILDMRSELTVNIITFRVNVALEAALLPRKESSAKTFPLAANELDYRALISQQLFQFTPLYFL